ncbi:LysM peptidoglycan-binding domain-containing protein [Paenibacillus sp. TAB 01]|uniref:LysM peptidoglycan-binding domain-containing protein n=1 Tax=Paenibacillus sp. TAB 01 TaxID=3368988 RepID=UPI003750970D
MNSIAFAEGLYAPLSRFDNNEQAGPLVEADNVQTASGVISAPKAGESVQAQAQDKAKEAPKKSASELTNKSQAAAESRLSVVTAKENTAAPSEKAAKANVKPSEDKVQTSAATVSTNPQSSTYRVKNGDTLYSISLAFYNTGDYVQLLADTNHLQSSGMLKEGQQLEIPYLPPADAKKAGSKANVAANGSTSSSDAAQRAISDNGKMINHVVKSGESLSSISQKYFGSPNFTEFIALLNNRSADAPLKVGETLVILPSGQD